MSSHPQLPCVCSSSVELFVCKMSAHNFETSLFRCPSPTPSQLVQIIRMEEKAQAAGTSSDSDAMFVPETPPHLQGRAATDEVRNYYLLHYISISSF